MGLWLLPTAYFFYFHYASFSKPRLPAALIQPQVLFIVLHCGDRGSSFLTLSTPPTCWWVGACKPILCGQTLLKCLYQILDTKIPNMLGIEFGENVYKCIRRMQKTFKIFQFDMMDLPNFKVTLRTLNNSNKGPEKVGFVGYMKLMWN